MIDAAPAPRYARKTRAAAQVYQKFTVLYGIVPPFPPTTAGTLDFVSYASFGLGKSSGAVTSLLRGLKAFCVSRGYDARALDHPVIKLQLKGLARLAPPSKRPDRVPITIWLLVALKLLLDLGLYDHVLLWAAMTCCLFAVLRAGVVSWADKDSVSILRRQVTWHPTHAEIFISIDKTHQTTGVTVYLYRNTTEACPFAALSALWVASPLQCPDAPLFQKKDGGPLRYRWFLASTKNLMATLGYDPAMVGTHCFKIGAATTLALMGYDADFVRVLGLWSSRSECFRRYIRISPEVFRQISLHLALSPGSVTSPYGDLSLQQVSFVDFDNIEILCQTK